MLVEIAGSGVLIEGAPGIGKSTLALELLDRGHRLIADDVIEVHSKASSFPRRRESSGLGKALGPRLRGDDGKILIGRCPALLYGYLTVRGLGALDVRQHFGAGALQKECAINLLIQLESGASTGDALSGTRRLMRCNGAPLPCIALQPGHNLAVLIEAACRAEQLRRKGFDAAAALARRQQKALQHRP